MSIAAIDYREQVLTAISDLSPKELEKVYRMVLFLKEEFLLRDEERYHTAGWLQAEQDATIAYQEGNVQRFGSVRELAAYIEADVADDAEA